ncbi:CD2-associated protein [Collichthys lucidus]|uniref:Osteoclast-stimulating factor 1 n=1 Tax=Collichthys lucidus TaxID=240159 RepID=A0A4U5ULA3_COLLU|nr:CD2-associated protein [Collichthys lucidus]
MSTIGIPTGGFQPQPPATAKKPKRRRCKVLFDYQPLNEDELELKVGDLIDINEEVEEGWWSGSLNGKSGLFPSNFVKELDTAGEDGESNDTVADEPDGSGIESTAAPTSPQPASGNGVIGPHKKIRGVGFGDIFREGSVKLKVRLPSPETEERKERPIPSLPSAAKPNMTDSQRADGDNKAKAKEYCKVTFTFEATNEDELSIKEGDIIHILSKDTGEPGWWRGEIGGKEGVFPDNFVTILSEAEKEVRQQTAGSYFHKWLIIMTFMTVSTKTKNSKLFDIVYIDVSKVAITVVQAPLSSITKLLFRCKTPPTLCKSRTIPSLFALALSALSTHSEAEFTPVFIKNAVNCSACFFQEDEIMHSVTLSHPKECNMLLINSSATALKPEVPSVDKKPHPIRPEDRDHKPSKPAAPVVPPKKPVPPPGKGRPGILPPKRPDKPLAPSPSLKHNGEVPSTRPKSEFEPSLPTKPKTLSADWGEKTSDTAFNGLYACAELVVIKAGHERLNTGDAQHSQDLMSFDDLSSTSEKLSHPTANRPKMPGRRLPAQFGGHSPNKDVSIEKSLKMDEEEPAKPKLTETRKFQNEILTFVTFTPMKPSTNIISHSSSFHKPAMPTVTSVEAKPSPVVAPSSDSALLGGKARLEPDEPNSQLDELRSQMKDLLLSVELLKAQQM